MARGAVLRRLLLQELSQRQQEGCKLNADEWQKRIEAADEDPARLNPLYDELMELPVADDFPFGEPSELDRIREASSAAAGRFDWPLQDKAELDRFHGAWLGRCIGCALGKPFETEPFIHCLEGHKHIQRYLQAAGAYPLDGYVPGSSPLSQLKVIHPASTREHIEFMQTDDDIRYTLLGLLLMEQYGTNFTRAHVGRMWLENLPFAQLCTAEQRAYLNLSNLDSDGLLTEDIDWSHVATFRNPYREWIGAQIRADIFGYAAAGWPELAAELAYRDAALSHTKNGIYGAMFVAAMIAAAFVLDQPREIIKVGLSQIPANCRLAAAVRELMLMADQQPTWQRCLEAAMIRYGHYPWVHAIPNTLVVVIAMLYGWPDFTAVVTTAVMCGLDTDCNGATAGSLVGAHVGAEAIPARFSTPLHDAIESELGKFGRVSISSLAKRTLAIHRKTLGMD